MRYAIVNKETNVVENVIEWDGETRYAIPETVDLKLSHESGIGDIWIESMQEFARPMSRQKPPTSQEDIDARDAEYNLKKTELQKNLFFVDPMGNLV